MRVIDLEDVEIPLDVLREVSETMAQLYRVVPLRLEGNTLTLATCDPQIL